MAVSKGTMSSSYTGGLGLFTCMMFLYSVYLCFSGVLVSQLE